MGRRIPLALVLVLFVGVAACSDGSTETETTSESSPPATDASTTAESTTTAPDLSVIAGPEDWDPILATVEAGEVPPAATCPDGTDPTAPGPVDQDRPLPGNVGNQAATFDRHAGRVMYLDSASMTWTFDVCTNTWTLMNPEGTTFTADLVYDRDSDVTVGFSADGVWVYDAATNAWTQKNTPSVDSGGGWNWRGALYDPLSGLIIGQGGDEARTLLTYDVDTDTWTDVGDSDEPNSIVGYSEELDKLVRYQILSTEGDLLDPRTGDIEPLPPTPDFGGGWGTLDYAADTDTAYVMGTEGKDICGFDPDTLGWEPCFDPADGPRPRLPVGWGAMVGDPINNRLILINPQTDSGTFTDDVWAIDLDTGEWTEILAATNASTTLPPDESLEYRDGARLTVFPPGECKDGGNPVVMTGGPSSDRFVSFFPERGYVAVSVDWREGSGTGYSVEGFTASVDDFAVAVRWVRANATELCADPERIAAVGYSYGAITSLLLAYTHGELNTGDSVSVDEVDVSGELPDARPAVPDDLIDFGDDIAAVVAFAGFALADTIEPGEPPCLLFNGRNDGTIPFELAEATYDAAIGAGISCELVAHDQGHSMANDIDEALDRADQFLQEHL